MAPTPEEQRWHWAEGNKYALEAMKSLLLLNGGSATALLTFFGTQRRGLNSELKCAIIAFAAGTVLSVVLFVCAYFVQLQNGNQGLGTTKAKILQGMTSGVLLLALCAFLLGLSSAYDAVTK